MAPAAITHAIVRHEDMVLPPAARVGHGRRMPTGLPDRPTDVLIIDDDWLFVEWACEAFRKRGFVARGAPRADGLKGLGEGRAPRLILLDQVLPGLGSRDFLHMVRREVGWASTPVVLLAGAASGAVPGDMPVDGVVRKPVELAQLMSLAYRYASRSLEGQA